ncbi:MAG: hypothetical protein KC456_07885 [Flavobacteriales bacterium]|nr:hypothetical protein [Flavobacteriales bacterium]
MFRSLLLIQLSLLISFGYQAQTKSSKVEVIWGPEFKTPGNSYQKNVVLQDESGLYNLIVETSLLSRTNYLQKFTPDLKLIRSEPQSFRTLGSYAVLESMFGMNNQIYAFTSRKSTADKTYSLFSDRIDKESLKPDNFAETIAEVDFQSGILVNRSGSFEYRKSGDESKLLVFMEQPYKRNEAEKFGFKVFDNEMKLIWNQDIELPYTDENFVRAQIRVGNNGQVYVLGRVYDEGTGGVFTAKDYRISILEYSGSGTSKEFKLDLDGKNMNELQMTVADNGDLICAGFYSEMGSASSSIKGSFYLRVNEESGEVERMRTKPFTSEFMRKGMREGAGNRLEKRMEKGRDYELNSYDIREIIRRKDGGALLVAERYFVVVTRTTDANGNTSTTYTYHYEDIVVVNIDPEGNIEWSQKVSKNQISKNDAGRYSGYALKVMGDKLFFIFNDNPKNLYYESGEPAVFRGNVKKAVLMLVEVDRAGNVERELLLSEDESDLYCRPKAMEVISENEMIMYTRRRKKNQLARIVFQ